VHEVDRPSQGGRAPMGVTGESHFTGCGAEADNPALARTCETVQTI
jgi:hypothetical protein